MTKAELIKAILEAQRKDKRYGEERYGYDEAVKEIITIIKAMPDEPEAEWLDKPKEAGYYYFMPDKIFIEIVKVDGSLCIKEVFGYKTIENINGKWQKVERK